MLQYTKIDSFKLPEILEKHYREHHIGHFFLILKKTSQHKLLKKWSLWSSFDSAVLIHFDEIGVSVAAIYKYSWADWFKWNNYSLY